MRFRASFPGVQALPALALLATTVAGAAPAKRPAASLEAPAVVAPALRPLEEVLAGDALVAYEAGRASFKEGDFATCHAKMKKAFELSKNSRLLRNLSTCAAKQRKYALAIGEAEQALALGELGADAIANLRESLEFWHNFVAPTTLRVSPPGAELIVDGERLQLTEGRAAIKLDIGKHELEVAAKGYVSAVKTLDVRDTDAKRFEVTLSEDVPETKLTVSTGPEARVAVDGAEVALGSWTGLLRPGPHHVDVHGRAKIPYASDVQLELGQHKTLVVSLEDEPRTWLWVGVGSALSAGLAVGAYFVFRPEPVPAAAPSGTAGTIVIP